MSLRELRRYLRGPRKYPPLKAPQIAVTREVLEAIAKMACSSPDSETGGILIGHHLEDEVRVIRATDAGPRSNNSACNFTRDTKHCQDILNHEFSLTGADYVGEWHSHVIGPSGPSQGDLRTLARIVLDPDYNFRSFVMILAVVRRGKSKISSYVVTKTREHRRENAWIVTISRVEPIDSPSTQSQTPPQVPPSPAEKIPN
jgi:integrative and conjugative element protein (TIGR02256 family)